MSITPDELRRLADRADAVFDSTLGDPWRQAANEIERLRKCLADTREEICRGPVDDVLWHEAVPACTTVDNITTTLGDGWSVDAWLAENAE